MKVTISLAALIEGVCIGPMMPVCINSMISVAKLSECLGYGSEQAIPTAQPSPSVIYF